MNVLGAFGLTCTSATSNVGAPPDWPKAATASRVIAPAHMRDCMVCISGGFWSALLLDAQTRGLGVRADLRASTAAHVKPRLDSMENALPSASSRPRCHWIAQSLATTRHRRTCRAIEKDVAGSLEAAADPTRSPLPNSGPWLGSVRAFHREDEPYDGWRFLTEMGRLYTSTTP